MTRFGTWVSRRGATLIDVALGSMLLTILLIPAIHLIGKSQSTQRRLVDRELLLYQAEQLIESTKIKLAEPTTFDAVLKTPIDSVQKIPTSDGPLMVGRLQVQADPTMPLAKLVNVNAAVWLDLDRDGRHDPEEAGETLQTQVAAP